VAAAGVINVCMIRNGITLCTGWGSVGGMWQKADAHIRNLTGVYISW
jgi:hypothetical protein